ncbi:MAG: tRNA (adenosine(37)-N6)-dimethylallyltransferase MiaA [Candidatus Magasanikbacteria bacterium]|nr:tRNA (adenosine(37)-N6)-dimethylallyltransferase MiaA [Candidatus Magasanikbacteria bacterium]
MKKKLPKLIVILGPTASGKTPWSLGLAQKFDGRIISADSRQIYKKMDIGTAKAKGEWRRNGLKGAYYVEGIPHYLIDFLDPGKHFSVAEFKDKAIKHIRSVQRSKKVPILVGGTGLYINSIVDNFSIPKVPGNTTLRESLGEKTNEELIDLLKRMDPQAASNIDQRNKRRVVRALEVCILSGASFSDQKQKGEALFDVLQIAPKVAREVLHARISERVDTMIEKGLLNEIQKLISQKYGWELSSMNGIGYRQFKDYFETGLGLAEAVEILKRDTRRFARRQMTWFKRDTRIHWVDSYEDCEKLVEEFLET